MVRGVNTRTAEARTRRVAATERRLVDAATRLFEEQGYAATTLAAVADVAGVAARTVYLRFGTKAALLKRAVDVAIVGDLLPIDVAGRDWTRRSMTEATLAQRISAFAGGARDIMQRAGRLLAVAGEAEPTEPEIANAAQAGRESTRDMLRSFWTGAASDGLLAPGSDVDWLSDTSALLAVPDTYLLAVRILHWDVARYEQWVVATYARLAVAASHRLD